MDRENKLQLIDQWIKALKKMEETESAIAKAIGLDVDGPLVNAFSDLANAYTDNLSALLDDKGDWLRWFWLENNLGVKALNVIMKQKNKQIRYSVDLLWCIEGANA